MFTERLIGPLSVFELKNPPASALELATNNRFLPKYRFLKINAVQFKYRPIYKLVR